MAVALVAAHEARFDQRVQGAPQGLAPDTEPALQLDEPGTAAVSEKVSTGADQRW